MAGSRRCGILGHLASEGRKPSRETASLGDRVRTSSHTAKFLERLARMQVLGLVEGPSPNPDGEYHENCGRIHSMGSALDGDYRLVSLPIWRKQFEGWLC